MSNYPFAKKIHTDGRKVTRRTRGFALSLDGSGNPQSSSFTIPFVSCLLTATEVINAVAGDRLKFEVLDTSTGAVSTIPNYSLNSFGEDVYPANEFYRASSNYDAELFQGLQIKITVTPTDTIARSIYFNLELHELS